MVRTCVRNGLDILVGGTRDEAKKILASFLPGTETVNEILDLLEPARAAHPNGLSRRRSKQARVLEEVMMALHKPVEQALCKWWQNLGSHPLAQIEKQLSNVPESHIVEVMERLLQEATNDLPGNPNIFDFFHEHHNLLVSRAEVPATRLILDYASSLVHESRKRDLMEFPNHILTTLLERGNDTLVRLLPFLDEGKRLQLVDKALHLVLNPSLDAAVAIDVRTRDFLSIHRKRLSALGDSELATSPALAAALLSIPDICDELAPSVDGHSGPVSIILPLARFAMSERPNLCGTARFVELRPEDVFLAACYYVGGRGKLRSNAGNKLANLRTKDDWNWRNVRSLLRRNGGRDDSRDLSDFRVAGLQPRIAELAFAEIHSSLSDCSPGDLRDLNREAIASIETWSILSPPRLPSEDWEDEKRRYDVKSNLYYSSYESKLGLRGFLIKDVAAEKANSEVLLPGIIFHNAYEEGCDWSFVGWLRPRSVPEPVGRRLSAFYFESPMICRARALDDASSESKFSAIKTVFSVLSADNAASDEEPSRAIVHRPVSPVRKCHPVVPLIYLQPKFVPGLDQLSQIQRAVLEQLWKQTDRLTKEAKEDRPVRLERQIWEAATRSVFELRSEGNSQQTVNDVLQEYGDLISSKWFPVHLPRIGSKTLLRNWIDSVLVPINDHWHETECPECCNTNGIRILPTRQTSESSIWGRLNCKCGFDQEVTLLTHCHECGHYPLIIGREKLCGQCCGLRCSWRGDKSMTCDHCKKGCVKHRGQI